MLKQLIKKNINIVKIFNEQENYNKKFFIRNTFEIYNYVEELWEVFLPNLINYVYKNGYYESLINDYINDKQIKIRPIQNTKGYTFKYDSSSIKNNYWIKKYEIEVIEEL